MNFDEINEYIQQNGIRINMPAIVASVESGDVSAEELFTAMLHSPEKAAWFYAWILNHCINKHADILQNHLAELIDFTATTSHTGLIRLLLRLIMRTPNWDNANNLGLLVDLCVNCLPSATIPTGVKANAMKILERCLQIEPDLKDEILAIITDQLPHFSVGSRNSAMKILKKYS